MGISSALEGALKRAISPGPERLFAGVALGAAGSRRTGKN